MFKVPFPPDEPGRYPGETPAVSPPGGSRGKPPLNYVGEDGSVLGSITTGAWNIKLDWKGWGSCCYHF